MLFSEPKIPQIERMIAKYVARFGFSALQRAENSSNPQFVEDDADRELVSVLFSEPKIPQNTRNTRSLKS